MIIPSCTVLDMAGYVPWSHQANNTAQLMSLYPVVTFSIIGLPIYLLILYVHRYLIYIGLERTAQSHLYYLFM